MRSEIVGNFPGLNKPIVTSIDWNPLDSPTATEWAEINLKKAQTGAALVGSGAIDGMDERTRIRDDPTSDYNGLPDIAEGIDPLTGEAPEPDVPALPEVDPTTEEPIVADAPAPQA